MASPPPSASDDDVLNAIMTDLAPGSRNQKAWINKTGDGFVIGFNEVDMFLNAECCDGGAKVPCMVELFIEYINDKLRCVPYMLTYTAVGVRVPAEVTNSRVPPWQLTLVCVNKKPRKCGEYEDGEEDDDEDEDEEHHDEAAATAAAATADTATTAVVTAPTTTGNATNASRTARKGRRAQRQPTAAQLKRRALRQENRRNRRKQTLNTAEMHRHPSTVMKWLVRLLEIHRCIRRVTVAKGFRGNIDPNVEDAILRKMPWLESFEIEGEAVPHAFAGHVSGINLNLLTTLSLGPRSDIHTALSVMLGSRNLHSLKLELCKDVYVNLSTVTATTVSLTLNHDAPPATYLATNENVKRLSVTVNVPVADPIVSPTWFIRAPTGFRNLTWLHVNVMLPCEECSLRKKVEDEAAAATKKATFPNYKRALALAKLIVHIPTVQLDITEPPDAVHPPTNMSDIAYIRKATFVDRMCSDAMFGNITRVRIFTRDSQFCQAYLGMRLSANAAKYTDPPLLSDSSLDKLEVDVDGAAKLQSVLATMPSASAFQLPVSNVRCRVTYTFPKYLNSCNKLYFVVEEPNVTIKSLKFDPIDIALMAHTPTFVITSDNLYYYYDVGLGGWIVSSKY